VRVLQFEHAAGLPLPQYATAAAAGLDLLAAVGSEMPMTLEPGRWSLVPTGIAIELPKGFEAQVRPRSGLALKHGITVLNSPGTIDQDYRGEVQVMLINHGASPFTINRGERIAQLVIAAVSQMRLAPAKRLGNTTRGAGGFGSTGVASTPPTPSASSKNPRIKKKTAAQRASTKKSISTRRAR